MADPAEIIAGRFGNLQERKFEFQQQRADTQDTLSSIREARAQALAEKQLAVEAAKLQRQTQADLDAAGFLYHFQGVHSDDPKYEQKRDQYLSVYPFAGHDETVRAVVNDKNSGRQTYQELTKSGGAYEFPEGPARDTFHQVFQQTRDFSQARAAAKQETEQIKAVRDAMSQGYLTNEDFATSSGQALPDIFHPDGKINYNRALDIAASRAGKTTGATSKMDDRELATAQQFVTSYLKNKETQTEADPVADQLYQLYSTRLLSHEQARTAGNQPTAAPAGTPAAAAPTPAKPAIVKQNGVTYTLQPDGSYK